MLFEISVYIYKPRPDGRATAPAPRPSHKLREKKTIEDTPLTLYTTTEEQPERKTRKEKKEKDTGRREEGV